MVSDLFVYELLLLGLLWLYLMLQDAGPSDRPAGDQRPSKPLPPPRKRSRDSKPFPGLIRTPPCAACAQAHAHGPQPPGGPPPRMAPTRGRPRQVDTSQHCCPHLDWAYQGWVGLDNSSANGHPSGGLWRQLYCTGCGGYFLETHGTPFHGKHVEPDLLVWAVGALAEGLGIRAVARVFEVDPNTVLQWLVEAADHLHAFSQYFLHHVHVTQVQLDELYALLRAVKAGEVSETEAIQCLSRSPQWVWVAIDPVTKLLLTIDVGDRTLAMAQSVVHQVVKTVRRRRLVRVSHRVIFGTLAAIEQVLAAHGWQINTAFVERLNLSIRQHVAAVGRRVSTLCKGEDGLRQQLALYQTYYNFCLPHASLRQPLPQLEPTHGSGSAKQWRPWTPAMAAGLTDHVWTLREVLLFRVPPWPQPAEV